MRVASTKDLVGRDDELAAIDRFLSEARDGRALVLEGDAGIGKTILWLAAIERAAQQGCCILAARPSAAERALAFGGLADLLDGLESHIDHLPAPQARALRIALTLEEPSGAPLEPRAVAAAVLGLLRRVAEDGLVVVAVDDFHSLDQPSTDALGYAIRRCGGASVGMLATRRTAASEDALADFEVLEIGPLPPAALDRLIRARLGVRLLRPALHQLDEASGGNPFYALELAASLVRSGVRPEPGQRLQIPSSLRDAVRERLDTLSPAAREAALVAATLATPTVGSVERAIEKPGAVREAVGAGVLEHDGVTLRFAHPLLAATLYSDASRQERKDLHARLAASVTHPEERALHLAEAADEPNDELAVALERAAASAARRGAAEAAVRFARQAFELTPPARAADSHRRRLDWARQTLRAGDPHRAEELLTAHLADADTGRERAEVELELGRTRLALRGTSEAAESFERALAELEDTDEPELQAIALIELRIIDFTGSSLDIASSARAVELAERCGRDDLLAHALGLHAATAAVLRDPPTEEFWQRAFAVEQACGELRYGGPTGAYSLALWLRGDFASSMEMEERVAASMRRTGDPMLPQVLLGLCEAGRISGDWDTAERYAEEAHDLVVQTGRESLEPFCLLHKARLALPRGDLDLARAQAEEARALAERLPETALERVDADAMAASVLAQIAEASEDYAEAHRWITLAREKAKDLGPLLDHARGEALAADVKCLAALGSLAEAERQLARLVELRDALRVPTLDGVTARAQGLLRAAQGDLEAAQKDLERAVEIFDGQSSAWPMQLGWSLVALGGAQRRARRNRAARESLQRALGIFEGLGARLWAEKARAELAQIGGRRSRPGALTGRETSVAELVARGRSNAEIARELYLSPKTVEWNLSKIYRKLHVRSRTELAVKLTKKATPSRS